MGSNSSKVDNEAPAVGERVDCDIDCNSDPRSPTPQITRTPLQGKTALKHNITKNADLRNAFDNTKEDEKLIHNNPILSAVIKNHLQSYDPRSPTQEFDRTPIIIGSKINDYDDTTTRQQQNQYGSPSLQKDDYDDSYDSCVEAQENLNKESLIVGKNLCNGFYDMTLDDTIRDTDEPLCSSTASKEAIESNMSNESDSKPTQLLETNFDFVETKLSCNDTETHSMNDAIESTIEDIVQEPLFEILNEDPRSPSVGIERTPLVVAKNKDECSEGNVEDMSDDTLIKVLQNTNADLRLTIRPRNVSDGVIIYEDSTSDLQDTPKKSKSEGNSGSRTPLSCMKNKDTGHSRSKSANTVDPKTQNALSKGPKRVSHIPRLKSLTKPLKFSPVVSSISLKNMSKAAAIGGDCENTPPHSHRDRWDQDTSIIL